MSGGPPALFHERVPAMLSGVALLLSASLVHATDIDAKSFRCITKMTPVRQFYVDNLQGNLDATLDYRPASMPNDPGPRRRNEKALDRIRALADTMSRRSS
jgi:hypothetical protein